MGHRAMQLHYGAKIAALEAEVARLKEGVEKAHTQLKTNTRTMINAADEIIGLEARAERAEAALATAIADERERCARVAADGALNAGDTSEMRMAQAIAAAIRTGK